MIQILGQRVLLGFLAIGASLLSPARLVAMVQPVVAFKAEPFPLQDVRLLDGPFKTAMERDAKYMLEIGPQPPERRKLP